MCGIIAGIYDNIYKILLEGLVQLQNRGYDLAGIAIINEEIKCIKKASTSTLSAIEYLNTHHINGNIGIGHTRWATHGEKNDTNSHPHISMCGKFALVHNGIIENYKELKNMLLENGYVMCSQTDTEIIVNLLSFYKKNNSTENAILKLINTLEGTWGLVIINIDEPNTLYATRSGSPLLVGYNETSVIITSEQSGFNNNLSNYFVLNNKDICIIKKINKNIEIDTKDSYSLKKINYLNFEINGYDHWMIKEIFEQEQTTVNALKRGSRLLENNKVRLGGLNEKKKNWRTLIILFY